MEQMISFGDKVDFKMKQIHTKHTCCYDNLCIVSLLTHYMALVNIGSGYGLLPDSTKL